MNHSQKIIEDLVDLQHLLQTHKNLETAQLMISSMLAYLRSQQNDEHFLNDTIKEFSVLYPDVEFTLGEPDESGKQEFFANGQNLKIRWSKKLVEDLIAYKNNNALEELRLILIEQLSISMSALKNSNENVKEMTEESK